MLLGNLYLVLFPAATSTPPPPPPPLQVVRDAVSSNSTAVNITWSSPSSSSPSSHLANFSIVYRARDGTERATLVPPTQHSLLIRNLSPGWTYTFRVRAVYADGTVSVPVNVTVELVGQKEGLLAQPWFYGALAAGGLVFLLVAGILVACICYQICCKAAMYKGMITGCRC